MHAHTPFTDPQARSWFESTMMGYLGAPTPPAPKVSVALIAEAHRRIDAVLDGDVMAPVLADAQHDLRSYRRGLDGPQRAMLARLVRDWLLCDMGWPDDTVAHALAAQATERGEADLAHVFDAMHRSQLIDWTVARRPRRKHGPAPGTLGLTRAADPDTTVWVRAPRLTAHPPADTWVQARLWPAGEGEWTLAPGIVLRYDTPLLAPQPDSPTLHPDEVATRLHQVVSGWWSELNRIRRLQALLPGG